MPTLAEILQTLDASTGRDFEEAVATTFKGLNLEATVIEETQAESDVIVEAKYAENPYYIVVECCAVEPQNQVPYTKLGQIRGNFTKYMDERRQKIFKNAYKLVVGRPVFSDDAKNRSLPDIGLLTVAILKQVLEKNSKYHFSQDELERLFHAKGEIKDAYVSNNLSQPFERKLTLYSLLLISLLENPFSARTDSRKPFTEIEQIVGDVKTFAMFLKIPSITDEEIKSAVRDLCSPFPALIITRDSSIRLASHPFEMLNSLGGIWVDLIHEITLHLEALRQMQAARPQAP
jgi:hypothetical protein